MLRGMYSSISAMLNLQAKQEVLSNNIANIKTTGYKSEFPKNTATPEPFQALA